MFSVNDIPRRLASAPREVQVDRAKDSTDRLESADMHMSTSSTYDITIWVQSGEVRSLGSIKDLI